MRRLTKKQIKIIARVHSAIHLSYIDGGMFDHHCGISEVDQVEILQEIRLIAEKLSNGHPMNLGSTEGVIKYARGTK
jgi:hypothetical protein